MCGILGSINIPFDSSLLDQIKHRGPDDFGIEKYVINGNSVSLGHRRLSIVDLSKSGHQPMMSQCSNNAIIFNGEIYNHLELKESLPRNIHFKGHSDTETILYYIREFGIKAIKNLNGIFGLAFLDIPNNMLYLARDRYGVKPLYYHIEGNTVLFSSELRPLSYELNPKIDLGTLGNCLTTGFFPAPFSPLEGICKLEPGEIISIELMPGNLTVRKSFFITKYPSLGNSQSDSSCLVKNYGDLFEKAVEKQLMADVDVGILLSGGVDSALVAAIAKAKSERKLKAFTVGYSSKFSGIDESFLAKETAQILGIEHYLKKCDFSDFLGSIKKIMEIVEEPIATTSIIPMYFLSKLASSKVKVVLSGQGADEPLGGYFKYRFLPFLNTFRKFDRFSYFSSLAEPYLQKREYTRRLLGAMSAKNHVKSYIAYNSISSLRAICEILNPEYLEIFVKETLKRQKEYYQVLECKTPLNGNIKDLFPFYDLRTILPDNLLMYTDKITMHFGLECRVPILDNDLIEFIESLAASKKFSLWNGKIIHKLFAREYLPSSIINRKKIGFKSPTEAWFRENTEEILEILSSNCSFNKLFSIDKVSTLLKTHRRGANLEKQIFLLLAISFLMCSNDRKALPKSFLVDI